MAKKKTKTTGTFEGTANIYAHRVSFRYWDFESELTPELQDSLQNEAEEKAKHDLNEGCHAGELNCVNPDNDEEIRGWWDIK